MNKLCIITKEFLIYTWMMFDVMDEINKIDRVAYGVII